MFVPHQLYTHEEIYRGLKVGNAGGIRAKVSPDCVVERMVVLTSVAEARIKGENPYHDRVEGNVLVYTGTGQEGKQTLAGHNKRIPEQRASLFPIYCFLLVCNRRDKIKGAKRWQFLGLLQYLRYNKERQIDVRGNTRDAWIFEFRIHSEFASVALPTETMLMREILMTSERATDEEEQVVQAISSTLQNAPVAPGPDELERIRYHMLSLTPPSFERLIKDVLVQSGFSNVVVTQYSQDGGIDVNAYVGENAWPLKSTLVQVQAKRWLHTVGRKEVAELRGSLQPYARGSVVTTSHFSRAALNEASETGKLPIVLVDGFEFARIVKMCKVL